MLTYLSTRVNTDTLSNAVNFRLAKRASGYYLYTVDSRTKPAHLGKEILCWDKASGKYVYDSKGYEADSMQAAAFYDRVQLKGEKHYYADQPRYGYEGWSFDVRAMLEGKPHLSDREIYALARTYSTELAYRFGTIGDPDFAPLSINFQLGDYPGHMKPEQLDTFRKYFRLTCQTYKRLWKQNPNFETLPGNIWLKYSNEVMGGFQELAYLQNTQEAMKEAPQEPLYDPVTLTFAHNLLASCDSGGILFVQGDNDTYPLYYMQLVKNERRDVMIVNLSLLQISI
jgi:hypothetical protein